MFNRKWKGILIIKAFDLNIGWIQDWTKAEIKYLVPTHS